LIGTAILGLNFGLPIWIAGMVLGGISMPSINSSNQAIWQSKVAPDVQGRVFSSRRMIAWLLDPITPIIAGLLADYVFEPFMKSGTGLAAFFGRFLGNTPGSGMGLQYILAGILYVSVVACTALFIPRVRNLEDSLPDHDQIKKAEALPNPTPD
jgi:DHA3 family macrolide efflux protein-like MFS transporter